MVDYTLDPESENKFSSYADKLSSMQGIIFPKLPREIKHLQ